jgi:cytochrome c oxidase subunit 4
MSQQDHHSHFIVPTKYYLRTFGALLVLTVLTVAVAQVDFGSLNLVIAMLVALVKASLVVMIFMGLKWEKGFNFVFFFGSLLFVGIFFALVFADIDMRKQTDQLEAQKFGLVSPVQPVSSEHGESGHH